MMEVAVAPQATPAPAPVDPLPATPRVIPGVSAKTAKTASSAAASTAPAAAPALEEDGGLPTNFDV